MIHHQYLIDTDGRMWCADNCPAETPHYDGELSEETS